VATVLTLASLRQEEGKYPEAEVLFQRALTIREKTSGPDDISTGSVLNNLAVSTARKASMRKLRRSTGVRW